MIENDYDMSHQIQLSLFIGVCGFVDNTIIIVYKCGKITFGR